MSFRLDPAMPMSEAVRRVAFGELEIAHAALATPPERHSGVHSARKCLKRLRSLLLLMRPGMPEPVFASLTERLRRIARGLAPARDAACPARRRRQARARDGDRARPRRRSSPCAPGCISAGTRPSRISNEARPPTPCAALFERAARHGQPCRLSRRFPPCGAKGLRDSYRAAAKPFQHAFADGRRRGFPRMAQGRAASLAAYAVARALLAVGAVRAGGSGTRAVADPRRRPRHLRC